MIRINLQSAAPRKASKAKARAVDTGGGSSFAPGNAVAAAVIAVPLAAGGGGAFLVHQGLLAQLSDVQRKTSTAEAELARLKPILDELKQFKKDKVSLEKKLETIRALEARRGGPVRTLTELASAMPAQVWVTSLRESSGAAQIEAIGLDATSVSVFVKALERSPYFANVELKSVDQTAYLGLKVNRFSVSCTFRSPSGQAGQDGPGGAVPAVPASATAPARR